MKLPPVVTEIAIGGLWCASAVKVFGYTWDSISSTWSTLPEPGSGSGGTSIGSAAEQAGKAAGQAIVPPGVEKGIGNWIKKHVIGNDPVIKVPSFLNPSSGNFLGGVGKVIP